MTTPKKSEKGLISGLICLIALVALGFIFWFYPLAFILTLPCWFFIRKKFVSIAIYVVAFFTILAIVGDLQPVNWYLMSMADKHTEYFGMSALIGAGGLKHALSFFGRASFAAILMYFLLTTVLVTVITFSVGHLSYFAATFGDPTKKLLKTRADAKPNFKSFLRKVADMSTYAVPLGVQISHNGKSAAAVPHNMLNKHVCLVGTTGSGKTTTLYHFINNAIYNGKPVIYIDGKGEYANIKRFKESVTDLSRSRTNPVVITIDGEIGYNPFASGTPTELTDKIMSMCDYSEEHYKLGAGRYIQLLLRYMELTKIDINLANIVRYCNLKTVKNHYVSHTMPAISGAAVQGQAAGQSVSLANIHQSAPSASQMAATGFFEDEAGNLLSNMESIDTRSIEGIQTRLAKLTEGDSRKLFEAKTTLDLNHLIETGGCVLFSLDSLRYPEQAKALGRLIVNDLKSCVSAHQRRGGGSVGMFFDEFNVFASHEIVDIINKSRSAGFEAVLAFQSLSDIDKLDSGEALRRQIVQNCNTFICQLQLDSKDAEEIASLFGTAETIEKTLQVDTNVATGLGSWKKVRDFNVHPDKIKTLRVGQAYIKIAGAGWAKVQIAEG